MSMTVEEALEVFNSGCNDIYKVQVSTHTAIKALEEIQQCRAIGTLEEFRQLKEKAMAKKPIYSDFDENEDEEIIPYKATCPVCGYEFEFGTWNDEQNHHCECGQRMLWGRLERRKGVIVWHYLIE